MWSMPKAQRLPANPCSRLQNSYWVKEDLRTHGHDRSQDSPLGDPAAEVQNRYIKNADPATDSSRPNPHRTSQPLYQNLIS